MEDLYYKRGIGTIKARKVVVISENLPLGVEKHFELKDSWPKIITHAIYPQLVSTTRQDCTFLYVQNALAISYTV